METCYKVMEREVAQSLNLESNRFDIEPEITAKLLRAGHSILELPIRFEPRSRAQGKKIGWRDGVRAIQVLFKYRFQQMTRLRQGYGRGIGALIVALAVAIGAGRVRRRARHVGRRRIGLVLLRADGEGVCERRSAAAQRAGRRAVAGRVARRSRPADSFPRRSSADAASPICAPGMSVLMAPLAAVFGQDAIFWLTPIAGVRPGPVGVRDRAAARGRHGRRHRGDPHRDQPDRALPGRAADERHPDGGAVAVGARGRRQPARSPGVADRRSRFSSGRISRRSRSCWR